MEIEAVYVSMDKEIIAPNTYRDIKNHYTLNKARNVGIKEKRWKEF